jgi:uncharacterized protein involved in exopolysaccharide biosynthesis
MANQQFGVPTDVQDSDLRLPESTWQSIGIEVLSSWKLHAVVMVVAGAMVYAITFALPSVYTARTSFIPPQPQNTPSAALASLVTLQSLTGGAGTRNLIEQQVSLLRSTSIADRIIERFDLMKVYESDFRVDARRELNANVRVTPGRRDGMIYLEVDDESPQRAAQIAAAFVDELGTLTSRLALTEAQQRRVFFETQVRNTREQLNVAQRQLQAIGFGPGALNAEPRARAEAFARLQAQITATEIRIRSLRRSLTDEAPELQQQLAALEGLQAQQRALEVTDNSRADDRYVSAFREFKYQEALLEVLARQYELSRIDESREGSFIQVVDLASPPERRTWPKRTMTASAAALAGLLLSTAFVAFRASRKRPVAQKAVTA